MNLSSVFKSKIKLVSLITTVILAGLMTLLGIYGIKEYGIALFLLTPFFIGLSATILFAIKKPDAEYAEVKELSYATLTIFGILLFVCAMEGLICLAMAAPIAIFATWLGSKFGYWMIQKKYKAALSSWAILIIIIPTTAFMEKDTQTDLESVTTNIDINADCQTVWNHVIEFPQLKEPSEFMFKAGIAYPISATIKGKGIGAVRYCNFTTGSFVEPITIWEEGKLLQFSVQEQPAPMKELSFWDIDAPHLHDYFVSKKGQFKLTKLSANKTRLEGTTWYYHNIKPAFYWKLWSNQIIHKIHYRVLKHIKETSEKV